MREEKSCGKAKKTGNQFKIACYLSNPEIGQIFELLSPTGC